MVLREVLFQGLYAYCFYMLVFSVPTTKGRSVLQSGNAPAYYSFIDYALSFSSGLAWAANSAFPSVLS